MIWNADEGYEPAPPFTVMHRQTAAGTLVIAGPFEELGPAISVFGAVHTIGSGIAAEHLILDGAGVVIFGWRREELRPPHLFGQVQTAVTPSVFLLHVPPSIDARSLVDIIDALRHA